MPDPRMPDFIIAGAAKCATTWLQQSLQASAGIWMPDPEPHYFSRSYDPDMARYGAWFADAPPASLIGEKSNSYMSEGEADQRIHRHLPDVRLIFQLRNPVDRAYSDYCMLLRRGEVDRDIARHLDPDRAAQGRFLRDGCYADHLQRYLDLFGQEQILVLLYENIKTAPEQQLSQLANHIGFKGVLAPPERKRVKDARAATVPRPLRRALSPFRPILDPLRHTAPMRALRTAVARVPDYPAFDPVLRREVADFYAPLNARLANAHKINLSVWS